MANTTKIRKRAEQLKGRPVCITLHDGRTYIGWITGLDKNGLTLSKPRKNKHRKSKKHSSSRSRKANVSGLMPLFGSLFGMGGGALGPQEQGLPVLEAVVLADLAGSGESATLLEWYKNYAGYEDGLQYD